MRLSIHISDIVVVAGDIVTSSADGGVCFRRFRREGSAVVDAVVDRRLRDKAGCDAISTVRGTGGIGSWIRPVERRDLFG